ncbi:MAG TPA: response regulator [Geobacteraceae bacterium]|nr:response regulator [Geobacteraceae bacterium]
MGQSEKILIADDEELIRLNLRALLEDLGYRVAEAADGREGLDAFDRERPDLVLVDLTMPVMNGISMIAVLREKSPETPIIVISGTGSVRDAVDSLRLGAWDYVLKPVADAEGLDIIIKRALEKARLVRENRLYREHLEDLVRERTEKLFQVNERWERTFDAVPDLIAIIDTDFRIVQANKAMADRLGLTPADCAGQVCYAAVHKTEAPHAFCPHMLTLRDCREHMAEIMEGRLGGDFIVSTSPVYDSAGQLIGSVHVARDITSLRKAEEERKLLEAQLHQAQKMEAIGQLAGGIAHDFNNILTAIIGYAEIIQLRLENNSPLRRFAEQVLTAADRAADLTSGLLAFSRRQVLYTKPIDLCGIVRDLEKMLGRLLPEDIDFRTTFPEGDLIVMADKGQIDQVLMNLMTNAKDAMPRGGTLTMDVSHAFMAEKFIHAHGFGDPGEYACISVTDTGLGMDEETTKRIFEPFFTTKEVGKGTGLGMAIIYGIIQQHNGCINVQSEKQRGTTFKIYLPRVAEEIKEVPWVRGAEAPPRGTETILLAEDDATVRELHKMSLEEAGYKIIEAVDGEDALHKFMEHMAEVDIVVTDVIMPKRDGKNLFDEIRRIRADMKVLFMSGYTKDIIVERGILENEFSYVTKPVKSCELLKAVRGVLDEN